MSCMSMTLSPRAIVIIAKFVSFQSFKLISSDVPPLPQNFLLLYGRTEQSFAQWPVLPQRTQRPADRRLFLSPKEVETALIGVVRWC